MAPRTSHVDAATSRTAASTADATFIPSPSVYRKIVVIAKAAVVFFFPASKSKFSPETGTYGYNYLLLQYGISFNIIIQLNIV